MKKIKELVTVNSTSYKSTSYYGNPSYWVNFTNSNNKTLTGYTANNAACGYGCTNFNGKRCEITYHYTRNNNIIIDYMAKVK